MADPADDGAEHVGQLGADDQEPLGVGLGWGDLQQWDQLPGGGEPVLDQAVVAELQQLLDPHAGQLEDFYDRPRPKGVILLPVEETLLAGDGIFDPDAAGGRVRPDRTDQGLARGGEFLARGDLAAGAGQGLGVLAPLIGGSY